MHSSNSRIRFHRLAMLFALFALMLSSLPMIPVTPSTSAQESGGAELGEPPPFDESTSASGASGTIDLAAVPSSVDLSTRASSRAFYTNHFVHSYPAVNWTGNLDNCQAGTISSAYKQAFVDHINWYRTMAGLSRQVVLSAEKSAFAQEAALMIISNGQLSHRPDTSWTCYSEAGSQGAGGSNLAYGCYDCVTLYMQDPGANNAPVGHRRWFLGPNLNEVGVGTIASWNATYVTGGSPPGGTTRDGFVAWPPPGYVPYQVVFPRWSFQYAGADFSNATVAVKRNGSSISPSIEYQDGNVVTFNLNEWYQPSADVRYTVTVGNVEYYGQSLSFTYDVVVFDPSVGGSGALPGATVTPTSAGIGETVDYTVTAFPPNSQVAVTLKRSGSTSLALGTSTTNSAGAASGSFTVPRVAGGQFDRIVFTSGAVTKEIIFEIAPRVALVSPWAVPGGEFDVRLSGFLPGQNVGLYMPESGTGSYWYVGQATFSPDSNGEMLVTAEAPSSFESGTYEIRFWDGRGNEHVAPGPVLVEEPPTAVTAGSLGYQASSVLTTVNLDASGSTGADGVAITDYVWSIGDEPIATGRNATAQLPVGTHNVLLTITDSYALTDTAPLTVTITVAPQTVIANAGPDQFVPSVGGSASVTLDASGSFAAPGASIASYRWTRAGQPTPIATTANPTVNLPIGTHEITLSVTSNFNVTTTDVVRIVVGAPPVANAGPDRSVDTYGTSASVTLNGSGSTPPAGHTITEYRWTGLPGGERTGVSPSVTLPVGNYTATLTVTASNGMTATDTVTVTVTRIDPPSISITPDRAAPVAKIAYTLESFPRGSEVAITWTNNLGVVTSLGTTMIDSNGQATGEISVPAGPGGFGNYLTFTHGSTSVSAEVDVAPRISPSDTTAVPGQGITLNLRGFAPHDDVLIRWRVNGVFVNLGWARTSSTGSVTRFPITIPANAEGGLNTIRVQGTISQQSSTVTIVAPGVSITPTRTTVNNWITYSITDFPANSPVSITWVRLTGSTIDMGTAQTDATGSASGQFRVPATPGGPGQQIRFSAGGITQTVLFELAPRIKVTPAPAERGEALDISLRGFARQEAVRIRWRASSSDPWIQIATGHTSNTGSDNIAFVVPESWADGTYSMRAETVSFNQQTNVVEIEGGVTFQSAAEVTPEVTPVPVEIDRSALPLDAPLHLTTITDEAGTLEVARDLTDGNLATGWSGTPDPERTDARLTIDLGAPHALRGFGWLTEAGGCGLLTNLEWSLDGETWAAIDPALQPGVTGEGMVWRYQAATLEARYLRFTFAPESPDETVVGCLAEVAVWGTAIVVESEPIVTPEPTTPAVEEPTIEPTPIEESAPESTPDPTVEPTIEPVNDPTPEPKSGE